MNKLQKELEELVLQIEDWNEGDRRSLIDNGDSGVDESCVAARAKLIKKLLAKLTK